MKDLLARTENLSVTLGLFEEPFGIYYHDEKPDNAYGPKACIPASREIEERGELDWSALGKDFSCVIGNIWLARKKHAAAYISAEEYGCFGGMYYTGVQVPYVNAICHYVSTGFPGTPMKGERYMPSPDAMRTFLDRLDMPRAPAKYCIFKPLSHFGGNDEPEFVTFFARPEVLSGLVTLLCFTTGDVDALVSPFGAGCTCIVGWPLYYRSRGQEKAVLGGFDPSARKFMKTDELTFTVSLSLYRKMLDAEPESLLHGHTWEGVRKKSIKSRKAWGEETP